MFTSVGSLNNDFLEQIVPPGTVIMSASAITPENYLLCDGSAKSRTDYASLFAAIGTAYGAGDSSTTFNLPDFRGRFPMGVGQTTDLADSITGTSYSRGGKGGEQVHRITIGETPEHQHFTLTDETTAGGDPATAEFGVRLRYEAGAEPSYYMRKGGGTVDEPTVATLGLSSPVGGDGSDEGTATRHNTIPPYSVVQFLIKT